ncbi:MAG: ABC transporter ATP-binding protein [Verrucomicrobiia bacterium]
MIQVDNLVKRYAGFTAVHGLTFSVQKGEIVGFLGPNGAGKSTTMRMLSCFMPATSGTAIVAGFDIHQQPLEVRRRIGYMPENVPLYPEMRVCEYLHFRAALKGVPRSRRKARVQEVSERCGIADVTRKIIGQLSKGYRQRVGLADALVHDPELIILDEPTIGLDPNQIRQVRAMIKDLARTHTVLLSTHILTEVEMTCSRVLIINRGKIVASDTPENLKRLRMGGGETVIELRAEAQAAKAALGILPGARGADAETLEGGYCRVTVHPQREEDLREAAAAAARGRGWGIRELTRRHQTLEDVFVQITTEDD